MPYQILRKVFLSKHLTGSGAVLLALWFALTLVSTDLSASDLASIHPKVHRSKVPAWVQSFTSSSQTPLNGKKALSAAVGIRYQLLDLQHNVVEDGADYFVHANLAITAPEGLSRANVEIEFDPDHQSLHFHKLGIRRKGHFIDLSDYAQVRLLDRERQWEAALLLGQKTLLVLLPDARVGDIIEYSYTLKARDPLWRGRFFLSRPMNAGMAVDRYVFRVRWPLARALEWVVPPVLDGLVPEKVGEHWVLTYDTATEPVRPAEGAKDSVSGWFEFSALKAWPELAQWLSELWAPIRSMSSPAETLQLWREVSAAEASDGTDSDQARVLNAVRWVQDRVRYLGLELGVGSLQPRPAQQVLRTRFGDCKDKALLLVTLLEAMDIEAWPVLVSTNTSATAYRLPMPGAFNHVIVQLKWRGQLLWIDPTRRWQGQQLLDLHVRDFPQGLVLNGAQSHWQKRPEVTPLNIKFSQLTLDLSAPGSASLSRQTRLLGQAAEAIRGQIERHGKDWFAQTRRSELSSRYGPLEESVGVEVDDEPEQHALRIMERYRFKSEGLNSTGTVHVHAALLTPVVNALKAALRLESDLVSPQKVSEVIELRLPQGAQPQVPESWSVETPSFSFDFVATRTEQGMRFSYKLESRRLLANQVPEARLRQLQALARLSALLDYRLYSSGHVQAKTEVLSPSLGWFKTLPHAWLSSQSLSLSVQWVMGALPMLGAVMVGGLLGISLQALLWSARRGRKSTLLFAPRPALFAAYCLMSFGLYGLCWLWLVYGTGERRQRVALWTAQELAQPPIMALLQVLLVLSAIVCAAYHTGQWPVLLLSGCAFLTLIPCTWRFHDWHQLQRTQRAQSAVPMRAPNHGVIPLAVICVPSQIHARPQDLRKPPLRSVAA